MILKKLIIFVLLQTVGVYSIGIPIINFELNYSIVQMILKFNDFNIIYFLIVDYLLALRFIGLNLIHWNAILKHLHADA